jgi:aminotransferase
MASSPPSRITRSFTESVIREMTRLTLLHGAVNLSQGFPDFPAPTEIKEAAVAAIRGDVNQYSLTWGAASLREAIAAKTARDSGRSIDAERNVTVTCGATEAMIATLTALVDPGDEVVIFEPFYENYGPDAILSRAVPRFVKLRPEAGGEWRFDDAELRKAFNRRTGAVIINTPNNPTGKVFTAEEMRFIAGLCREWDAWAVTDEIYEHILFDGARHLSIAGIEGMTERTVTISSISKTYSLTGWRVGWTVAPSVMTDAIRKVHDFFTVGAPSPLQEAAAVALGLEESYYEELRKGYQIRRDLLVEILEGAGFRCGKPRGAYYVMADAAAVMARTGHSTDRDFARWLIEEVGVASVPGSSFFRDPADGRTQVRFCFAKEESTLREAGERLERLRV